MKRRRLTSSTSNISVEGEEGPTNQLSGEVKLGDLIWVRLRGSSWWPAQVVDANTVSEGIKPSNRSVGEVLVRLYGSYEYLFVDPMKFRSEFEHVLKQNNGSYREIFHKSLERDRPRFNCCGSKGEGSTSKVEDDFILLDVHEEQLAIKPSNPSAKVSRSSRTPEKDDLLKKLKPSPTPTSGAPSSGISRELSGRRVKVMQSLGLVAPSGSPFQRVGRIYPFCD